MKKVPDWFIWIYNAFLFFGKSDIRLGTNYVKTTILLDLIFVTFLQHFTFQIILYCLYIIYSFFFMISTQVFILKSVWLTFQFKAFEKRLYLLIIFNIQKKLSWIKIFHCGQMMWRTQTPKFLQHQNESGQGFEGMNRRWGKNKRLGDIVNINNDEWTSVW